MHGRGDPPLRAAHAASQLCPSTVLNTHCCPPAEVVGLQADESVEPAADTWPAGQAVHGGLPLGPKKPALHVQAAEVVDPGGLLETEGQSVQTLRILVAWRQYPFSCSVCKNCFRECGVK